jgi:hypothetical protein
LDLRNRTYAAFVELGRAPAAAELGEEAEVRTGWRQLHEAHALVLNPATDEIRMANPFSAVPTAYRVHADGRWWYANCAWDAFGVLSALKVDGRIESSCPDSASLIPSRSSSRGSIVPTCCSIVLCPQRTGGTTSSSPEV